MNAKYVVMPLLASFFLLMLSACSDAFLEKKPDKALLVPVSLDDFQAILDNIDVFNSAPGLPQIAGDDFFITAPGWQGLTLLEKNTYIWKKDLYGGTPYTGDWNVPYTQIFTANVVLDGLDQLGKEPADQIRFEQIRASALFFRALAFYDLSQLFAPAYDAAAAPQLPGIALRLSSDVTKASQPASLQQTYDQILLDLNAAAGKLPAMSAYRNRPSAAAAHALLARVYLQMKQYDQALAAADQSLAISSELLDYNTLDSSQAVAFPLALPSGNVEVLYYDCLLNYGYLNNALTFVDTLLLSRYAPADLRASLFFQKTGDEGFNFRGTYSGGLGQGSSSGIFCGLATDEVYLVKAECLARADQAAKAMEVLNTLLEKRWKKNRFRPLSAGNAATALALVLEERRKELVGRGLRWADLRRLNPEQPVTLKRVLADQVYELPAGDTRYTFPVPPSETNLSQP